MFKKYINIYVCLKCYIKHGMPEDPAEFSDLMDYPVSVLPTVTSHPSIRKIVAKYACFKKPTNISNSA